MAETKEKRAGKTAETREKRARKMDAASGGCGQTAPSGGCAASGQAAARARETMADALRDMLARPVAHEEGGTEMRALLTVILEKAKAGDLPAAAFLRDTLGEKPKKNAETPPARVSIVWSA